MAENTKIEWCHHTFNPWIGCARVSEGCRFCYAEHLMDTRLGKAEWGPNGTRVVTSDSYWRDPIRWNREAAKAGERWRVFPSLCDPFEDREDLVPHLARFVVLIEECRNLDWLLLTKRPQLMMERLGKVVSDPAVWLRNNPHVWLGTSVERQQEDWRIAELLKIPAAVRFLSMEPLLSAVDLRQVRTHESHRDVLFVGDEGGWEYAGSRRGFIDWVIVGGESGPHARPMHPDWARDIRDQCQAGGVPFHFKQWGEWRPIDECVPGDERHASCHVWPNGDGLLARAAGDLPTLCYRVGKKAAGRTLDGRTWDELPHAMGFAPGGPYHGKD